MSIDNLSVNGSEFNLPQTKEKDIENVEKNQETQETSSNSDN